MYSQSRSGVGNVWASFTSRYQGWIHTDRILQCSGALYKDSSDTREHFTGLLLHLVLLPHPQTSRSTKLRIRIQ